MTTPVKTGDPIRLFAHIEDDISDKFVQVILKDGDNVELSESPIALTNSGDGTYFNNSIGKPAGVVRATYTAYDDAAFLLPNADIRSGVEEFIDITTLRAPQVAEVVIERQSVDVVVEQNKVSVEVQDQQTSVESSQGSVDVVVDSQQTDVVAGCE